MNHGLSTKINIFIKRRTKYERRKRGKTRRKNCSES